MIEISKLKLCQSSSSDNYDNLSESESKRTNLLSEIKKLKKENEDLKIDLLKFTSSSSIMNKLLKYGRSPFDRSGLGFDFEKEGNENSYNIPISICRRYGKSGHIEVTHKGATVSKIKTQNKNRRRFRNKPKNHGKPNFPKPQATH